MHSEQDVNEFHACVYHLLTGLLTRYLVVAKTDITTDMVDKLDGGTLGLSFLCFVDYEDLTVKAGFFSKACPLEGFDLTKASANRAATCLAREIIAQVETQPKLRCLMLYPPAFVEETKKFMTGILDSNFKGGAYVKHLYLRRGEGEGGFTQAEVHTHNDKGQLFTQTFHVQSPLITEEMAQALALKVLELGKHNELCN